MMKKWRTVCNFRNDSKKSFNNEMLYITLQKDYSKSHRVNIAFLFTHSHNIYFTWYCAYALICSFIMLCIIKMCSFQTSSCTVQVSTNKLTGHRHERSSLTSRGFCFTGLHQHHNKLRLPRKATPQSFYYNKYWLPSQKITTPPVIFCAWQKYSPFQKWLTCLP